MLSQSAIRSSWAPHCRGPFGTVKLHGNGKVTVKAAAVEATKALNSCLQRWDYQTIYHQTGAFVCRGIAGGRGWSLHAYGIAIDINWQLNPYGGYRYHIPSSLAAAICRIRTNNGKQVWNWGGYWRGTKDWMHFEIVCSPRDLASGINWSTVNGPVAAAPKPPSLADLRRWTAGVLAERAKNLPNLHDKVPSEYAGFVKLLQECLIVVKHASIKVDGIYGPSTLMHVIDWQNSCRALGLPIRDPQGYFGDTTKWWLVKALENIRDGRG